MLIVELADRAPASPQFPGVRGSVSKQIDYFQCPAAHLIGKCDAPGYGRIVQRGIRFARIEHDKSGFAALGIPRPQKRIAVFTGLVKNSITNDEFQTSFGPFHADILKGIRLE